MTTIANTEIIKNLNKVINEALNEKEEIKREEEKVTTGKYFYIVGEAEKTDYYTDYDTGITMSEPVYVGRGWEDKSRFDTFEEVLAEVVEDGYWNIESTCNFPDGVEKDLELLTNEDEAKLTPKEYPKFYELLSYYTEKEEDFGDEDHYGYEIVTRLIQICKEKEK